MHLKTQYLGVFSIYCITLMATCIVYVEKNTKIAAIVDIDIVKGLSLLRNIRWFKNFSSSGNCHFSFAAIGIQEWLSYQIRFSINNKCFHIMLKKKCVWNSLGNNAYIYYKLSCYSDKKCIIFFSVEI